MSKEVCVQNDLAHAQQTAKHQGELIKGINDIEISCARQKRFNEKKFEARKREYGLLLGFLMKKW